MSLLSRSRGSKGYGACGDMPRPRADQGGPKPAAMEREYSFILSWLLYAAMIR